MAGSQRRLRNYLLHPLLQIKLGLIQVLMAATFSVVVLLLFRWQFFETLDLVLDLTDLRDDVTRLLTDQMRTAIWYLAGISVLFIITSLSLAVFYTHRLIGPTVAFNRHLEALLRGDTKARTVLRKHDAFQETASRLNALSEYLHQQQSKSE